MGPAKDGVCLNVLFVNIGRRNYLVEMLKSTPSFNGRVLVSDWDETAVGLYGSADGRIITPRQRYQDYCPSDIDIIIPVGHYAVWDFILDRKVTTKHQVKAFTLVTSEKVFEICNDKLETHRFLTEHGFAVPVTLEFPVIAKTTDGSGGKGMEILHDDEQDSRFIQEYIYGQEYGVDVFNDSCGKPVRICIKKKLSMRAGETDKAVTVKDEQIFTETFRLATLLGELGHTGPLDIDLIKNDQVYFIDLNPRFGGGYPATHNAGVNFFECVLALYEGKEIEPNFDYKTNILTMKDVGIKCVELP